MKIGLVCPYDMNRGGGVQIMLKDLQQELRARDHDVWIITPRLRGYAKDPDAHTIFVGTSRPFRSPTSTVLELSSGDATEIAAMLEREQFDVLNFHEPLVPMIGYQVLRRSTSVNVGTFHATIPDNIAGLTTRQIARPFALQMLKHFDAFTAVSSSAASYITSLTSDEIAIIPTPLNVASFTTPASFDDERPRKTILYVGRLEGRKGLKYLLRAFHLLQANHADVRLRICGEGPDREKLEAMVSDLDLKHVSFMGYITEAEKRRYLRESDLFCAPAVFGESLGIVLLEAMASGLVIVAGDNAGYATVMTDLGGLSLVDPKHTIEFARRLDLLLYQPALRHVWRKWAKSQMPMYAVERVASEYLTVYKRAVAAKRRKQ